MKTANYWFISVFLVLCSMLFNSVCHAEDAANPYSQSLRQILETISNNPTGRPLPPATDCWRFKPLKEELGRTGAVPFLIQVIQQGPDWQNEYKGKTRLIPHVARGYAALCLAYTRDERAFPILIELLEKGKPLIDINTLHREILEEEKRIDEIFPVIMDGNSLAIPPLNTSEAGPLMRELQQDYDIRAYAAASLGILKDARAINALVKTLNDHNAMMRYHSVLALAEFPDMRTIEPILQAATTQKIDGFAVSRAMIRMTKYQLNLKVKLLDDHQTDNTVMVPDYPELGVYHLDGKNIESIYPEFWNRWYKNGKRGFGMIFEDKYNRFIQEKLDYPEKKEAQGYRQRDIASLGVPALPMLIQKIEQGETDLIPIVAELTNNEISRDADKTKVLQWWKENKERWIIFKEE